ncbi:hypothetical protein Acr_08g0013860 [Actinidia rufa]|uniref:Uncharacterized protein n=1 Tax=Actinidia rufa TaxID=165716 RepID=A0A7J0F2S9_9ERIC|nr:hypothetical protein Acr_08g0013860 [Actinidia rufa]
MQPPPPASYVASVQPPPAQPPASHTSVQPTQSPPLASYAAPVQPPPASAQPLCTQSLNPYADSQSLLKQQPSPVQPYVASSHHLQPHVQPCVAPTCAATSQPASVQPLPCSCNNFCPCNLTASSTT